MNQTAPNESLLLIAAPAEAEAILGADRAAPTIAGEQVRLCVAGVGRGGDASARAALAQPLRLVLNIGLSGCLDGSLPSGSICLVDRWIGEAPPELPGDPAPMAGPPPTPVPPPVIDPRLMADIAGRLARAGLHAERAVAVTVDAPLHDETRRERFAVAGARLVDMESGAWADLAAEAGVPFVSIRVVSDAADAALPLPRHLLLRVDGTLRRGVWLRALATQPPWRWPGAQALLRRARAEWIAAMGSLRRIGAALPELLRDGSETHRDRSEPPPDQ